MTRPRVVFVINSLSGGGAERVLSRLLAQFVTWQNADTGPSALREVDLGIVLLDREAERYAVPAEIPMTVLDARHGFVSSFFQLFGELRRQRPALIMSFLTRANCASIAAAQALRFRTIVSERVHTTSHLGQGRRAWLLKGIVRALYPRAGRIIAVSDGVGHDLVSNFGVSRDRVVTIPNPYDLDRIEALAREEPGWRPPEGRRYLVALGRLVPMKNFSLLIRAYAQAGIDADLVILGEGEEEGPLRTLAQDLGCDGHVHLPGFLDNPYAVLRGASAFAMSSNAEGFPNALAEAMVLGLPVVAADCPSGPGELLMGRAPSGGGVVETSCGLLVPVHDVASMAEALRRLFSDPRASGWGTAAAVRMSSFDVEKVAALYAREIAQALGIGSED